MGQKNDSMVEITTLPSEVFEVKTVVPMFIKVLMVLEVLILLGFAVMVACQNSRTHRSFVMRPVENPINFPFGVEIHNLLDESTQIAFVEACVTVEGMEVAKLREDNVKIGRRHLKSLYYENRSELSDIFKKAKPLPDGSVEYRTRFKGCDTDGFCDEVELLTKKLRT